MARGNRTNGQTSQAGVDPSPIHENGNGNGEPSPEALQAQETDLPIPLTQDRRVAQRSALEVVYHGVPEVVIRQCEAIRWELTSRVLDSIEIVYDLLRPYGKFAAWCRVMGLDAQVLYARFSMLRQQRRVLAETGQIAQDGTEGMGTAVYPPSPTLAAIARGDHQTKEERMLARMRMALQHADFQLLWSGKFATWLQDPDRDPDTRERCRQFADFLLELVG